MKKISSALALATVCFGAPTGSPRAASAQVAYVTDNQRDVVSVLDTATNTVTGTIPVGPGIRPCGITLSPDGLTAYVANPTPDTVSVINLTTLTTSNIDLRCPADACSPGGILISPDGRLLYVVSEEFEQLAITEIDAHAHAVGRTFRVNTNGGVSGGCTAGTVADEGRLLFVRVVTLSGFALSVIDMVTGAELTRLDDPPFGDVAALPSGNAVAAVTKFHFPAVSRGNAVAIIDAATQAIERMIPIEADGGLITVSPDGSTGYVVGDCAVAVVDLAGGRVKRTIPLDRPCSVWDVAVTPDGTRLLIADLTGPSVIQIDTVTDVPEKTPLQEHGIGSLAVAPDSTTLYVANGTPGLVFSGRSFDRAGALIRVDLRSGAVTSFFPPAGPSAVAATPDGDQLYVANGLSEEVVVVDAAFGRAEARIPVASPSSVAVDPAGNRVFVGSSGHSSGRITVIDRNAGEIADSVALDGPVSALAIAPDGNRLYAATNAPHAPAITVIDAPTLTAVTTIPVEKSLTALAVAPDGHELYAAESQYAFNEITGSVAVIDLAAERVQTVIATGGVGDLAVNPDGGTIYAPTGYCCLVERPAELSVIDVASQTIRATPPLDGAGRIAITPDGRVAYVTSPGRITAIDTSTLAVTATVDVGISPTDIAIAREPAEHPCAGDCDGDGTVTVAELMHGVRMHLETAPVEECRAMDANLDGQVSVGDLLRAVNEALTGCSAPRGRPSDTHVLAGKG